MEIVILFLFAVALLLPLIVLVLTLHTRMILQRLERRTAAIEHEQVRMGALLQRINEVAPRETSVQASTQLRPEVMHETVRPAPPAFMAPTASSRWPPLTVASTELPKLSPAAIMPCQLPLPCTSLTPIHSMPPRRSNSLCPPGARFRWKY